MLNLNEDSESHLMNSMQAISRITAFSDQHDDSGDSSDLKLLEKQRSSADQVLRVMKQESFTRSVLAESSEQVLQKHN